jgi:glyoxylate/hydroxypyruvate reductase A
VSILLATGSWDPSPWRERLARHFPDRQIAVWPDVVYPSEVEHAVCWRPEPGLLSRFPNLKAIHSLGAGVDHLFADPDLPNVTIVRVIDPDLTNRMSEWVALNVLLHHRQTLTFLEQQRARLWKDPIGTPAARDIRVGVMGMGELGRDAAWKLQILGYDVAGWSRSGEGLDGMDTYSAADLDEFLARTDILVVLLPLTASTRGILNRDLFSKLARHGRLGGPVLINAGRGGLQVDADILSALADGILMAASLDVFETEPLPASSPFWNHPRVLVTPHVAAESDAEAVSAFIARQIRTIDGGGTPQGVVDRVDGY